jgi:hypothetical protein
VPIIKPTTDVMNTSMTNHTTCRQRLECTFLYLHGYFIECWL